MIISLDLLTLPNGATYVLPDLTRLAAVLATADEAVLPELEEVERQAQAMRKDHRDQLRRVTFTLARPTLGQKLAAQREAMMFDRGAPRMDQGLYGLHLLAAALGEPLAEVEAMDPAIGAVLIREVVEMVEPRADQLDFFFARPTSSA
jgi:hypothetical protein